MKDAASQRFSTFLERRSGWIVFGVLVVTLLLVIPLIALAPDEQASTEPGGPIFDLRDLVEERFPPAIYVPSYMLESPEGPEGDVLTQAALWELYQNEEALRRADERGELSPPKLEAQTYLYRGNNPYTQLPIHGVYSVADGVQDVLNGMGKNLEHASDDEVKLALHLVFLENSPTFSLRESLSGGASFTSGQSETIGNYRRWRSPAIIIFVNADNNRLGGGPLRINIGGDETAVQKEHLGRNVQSILRGEERNYRLWGIAIDPNLESQDEGRTAIPFILATALAALAVTGISLRSWSAVFITAAGLTMLILWLKGISNLLGLKGGLVVELIVPIAMISLGVDFAIHALHRYREERRNGLGAGPAFRVGFAGVAGALVLAMLTDGAAFLSNAVSGIESITGFGIAAAIAVASSLVIMGVFVPLVFMRLDARRETGNEAAGPAAQATPSGQRDSRTRRSLGADRAVAGLARRRLVVLPVAVAVTGAALIFAIRLEAQLDARDFFVNDSDFVVGLDKFDQHLGANQGEPGIIYIEGDLSASESLEALRELQSRLKNNPHVAKGADGEPTLYRSWTIFELMEHLMGSDYALAQMELITHMTVTDADGDMMPDTPPQIRAAFGYIAEHGIPLSESTWALTPAQVQGAFFHDPNGHDPDALQIRIGLPGTREQSLVSRARQAVRTDLEALEAVPSISATGVTGSAFTRAASLDAAVRSSAHLPAHRSGVLLPDDSSVHEISALCSRDHHPHRPGGDLAVRHDAPDGISPQLRDRHHRGGLHRSRCGLLHPHDPAVPGRDGKGRRWNARDGADRERHGDSPHGVGRVKHLRLRDHGPCSHAHVLRLRHSHRRHGPHGGRSSPAGPAVSAVAGDPRTPTGVWLKQGRTAPQEITAGDPWQQP